VDEALLSYLACPRCASDLLVASTSGSGQDIISGSLDCTRCSAKYPIVAGIPRLSTSTEGLENVARAFACEWEQRGQELHLGLTDHGVDEDLRDRVRTLA
jgi:uncharacterized protein YbaR (Trm112 family)